MNKVSKKSLKSSKKDATKLVKNVKSKIKKESNENVVEDNVKEIQFEIDNNLTEIRKNIDSNANDTMKMDISEDSVMKDSNKLFNFNVKTMVANNRVIIVKNINKDSKIEDVLSLIKNKDDILKSNALKVRNRGVKTQMLTIEFKSAHHTNGLIEIFNKTVIDGNNLVAEYRYTEVDSCQRESLEKTKTFVIKNLPLNVDRDGIKELVKDFDVSGKCIKLFKKFGKNCCFIHFNSIRKATNAFEILKEKVIDGVKLEIKFVSENKETEVERNEKLSNAILHITNIPFTATRAMIEKEFDMADSIKFPLTAAGKSKGCCYLVFKSPEMATLAADALKDKVIEGRKIKVDFANVDYVIGEESKQEESVTVADISKKRVRSKKDKNLGMVVTLFNLPTDVTIDDIKTHFSDVESVSILKSNNIFKGIADVLFKDKLSAKAALKTAEFSIKGRVIRKELKGGKKAPVSHSGVKKEEAMET